MRLYRIALMLDPMCAAALYNLGRLVATTDNVASAAHYVDRAAELDGYYKPHADLTIGVLLARKGNDEAATPRLLSAALSGCAFGEWHAELGRQLWRLGYYGEARQQFTQFVFRPLPMPPIETLGPAS